MQFPKISIPTPWKVIRNFLGEGVLKVKILEAKYGISWGDGVANKKPSVAVGGVWVFSGTRQWNMEVQ